ncbi:MAG: outer membrane beta-barrel protein [Hyphomicrobiaceae bacterium]|nr:outer membrane beta-barrel protein [Hyphomicrobiaceae bacterium]
MSSPSGASRNRASGPYFEDNETAPDLPPIISSDDPTADFPEDDSLAPRPGPGQRAVLRDGDLSYPPEPRAQQDGRIDQPEQQTIVDGIDPMTIDTRSAEDFDAFENPPAGYDPLLFQIEDIDPLSDRRTRRLARFEPYDPVGIRIGSFVMFPEIEIGGSGYSNVLRSQNPQSDVAIDVRPTVRVVSDWNRHALEFSVASTLSFYNEFDSENDRAYRLEARGRVDITSRTNVQAFAAREYSQESRSAIDANAAGERADLTLHRGGGTISHRFNRLTLQLRGSVNDYQYSDVDVGGVTQSNRDRNYTATEEAIRATWEFKPTLQAFTEVAINQRRYETIAQSDGISRDSDGERYRVGLSFGTTGRVLRGEVAVGYGRQTPTDGRLEPIEGIIVDANIAWRPTELTTVLLNARSDVSETTTAGSGGVFTRAAGVEVRHAFRRHLIGTAGITYTDQDYVGVPIAENEILGDLGLEYFLSREAVLFGRYRHTRFNSNSPGASYDSDEVKVGVRLRR